MRSRLQQEKEEIVPRCMAVSVAVSQSAISHAAVLLPQVMISSVHPTHARTHTQAKIVQRQQEIIIKKKVQVLIYDRNVISAIKVAVWLVLHSAAANIPRADGKRALCVCVCISLSTTGHLGNIA